MLGRPHRLAGGAVLILFPSPTAQPLSGYLLGVFQENKGSQVSASVETDPLLAWVTVRRSLQQPQPGANFPGWCPLSLPGRPCPHWFPPLMLPELPFLSLLLWIGDEIPCSWGEGLRCLSIPPASQPQAYGRAIPSPSLLFSLLYASCSQYFRPATLQLVFQGNCSAVQLPIWIRVENKWAASSCSAATLELT